MEYSKYQLDIFDAYENTKKNMVIVATAGAGKSFVLVELSKRTPSHKRQLFMAFNKSIAQELSTKLPETCECSTFHSKGLRVLYSTFKFKMSVVEDKCFALCTELFSNRKDIPNQKKFKYFYSLQELWDKTRLMLLDINQDTVSDLCVECDIEFEYMMVEDLLTIQKEWRKRAAKIQNNDNFVMDFTDMLWIPYIFLDEMSFPKYDVVMLDESQDIFKLQKELLPRYMKTRGRFVAVGDFSQLIYQFMGSDVDNFKALQEMPNTLSLPLSVSYRCAKAIVEEAKTVFPTGIEAAPNAKEGIVREGKLTEAENGDFVLCRNNLPLIAAFLELTEAGKKANIVGRDFGESLCRILDQTSSVDDLDVLLDSKLKSLASKGMSYNQAKNKPSYIDLQEKCEILKLLYKRSSGNYKDLKDKIQDIFTEKSTNGIILSTIHKSKGLEARRVFFLNSDLLPSKYANTEKALYAEKCLQFVAITRAKEELVYCYI